MLVVGQVAVPGNSTVPAFTLPPGYSNCTFWQQSTPQVVYLGTSSKVSSSNGMQVSVTPMSTESVLGSSGATYYATTGNATATTFQYIISATN